MQLRIYRAYLEILQERGKARDPFIEARLYMAQAEYDRAVSLKRTRDFDTFPSSDPEKRAKDIAEGQRLQKAQAGKEELISPVILEEALKRIKPLYRRGQEEFKLIDEALAGLEHWKNPIAAYNATPVFERKVSAAPWSGPAVIVPAPAY